MQKRGIRCVIMSVLLINRQTILLLNTLNSPPILGLTNITSYHKCVKIDLVTQSLSSQFRPDPAVSSNLPFRVMQVPIEMSTFYEISINFNIIRSYIRLPGIQTNQVRWRLQPHGAGLTLQNSPAVGNILSDPTIFLQLL